MNVHCAALPSPTNKTIPRMKRRQVVLLPITALATGCASDAANKSAAKTLERQKATQAIRRMEIVYDDDPDIVVLDGGGSGLVNMSGLLGPLGMLVGLAAHGASKATMADRVGRRSKEFTAAAREQSPDYAAGTQIAMILADLLRASGREVKLTKAARPTGSDRLADSAVPDVTFSPGFAVLVLRTTVGYAAESATASYRPMVVAESVLRQTDSTVLNEDVVRQQDDEPSYATYSGLLGEHVQAFEALQQCAARVAKLVYAHSFEFASPAA